jgi:two-component system sensor histidine kinase CpxA
LISVRDRGQGVPEESLEKIFRPFYRTEDARDRQSGGGTGLGLAITERAVRMHGGTVEAHNAKDGGLSVELRLRL